MNRLDQVVYDIANEQVPEGRMEEAASRVRRHLFAHTTAEPVLIRTCADYQALIPSYLNKTLSAGRALLLQDHTRECVGCRHALDEARAGSVRTLVRPTTPPSRTIPKQWAIAAAAVLIAGAGALAIVQNFGGIAQGRAVIQTVYGILYAVNDRGNTPIFSGREIADGEHIRTAKGSIAMVRLPDGSLMEMNERTEVSFTRASRGMNIRLDRGGVIVQAAKQRGGTLDVLTPDCTVLVKGTIFAVERGTKASRVSVVEGSVQVEQGAQSQMLKPGDQVATDPSVAKTSVEQAISWSRDSARYMALIGEFAQIKKGLDAVPSPGLRHDAKLLAYVDPDAVLYAAIPNLGSTLGEAQRLFNERLQQSEVLRTWWQEQKDGPKLEEMVQKLRNFSDYLGDEIVLTVSGDWDGNYSAPMLLAEVKRSGLDGFLNTEFRQLAIQGQRNLPQVLRLEPSQSDSERGYYQPRRRAGQKNEVGSGPMLVGLNDKVVAVAWDQAQLNATAQRIADPASVPGGSNVVAQVRDAYRRGVNYLLCVNMEHIARNLVSKQKDGPVLPTGLEGMRYLTVERKDVGSRVENEATLNFAGRRSGMAGWLAEPSPMGSLDFVSPNATFAMSMALREPRWMLGDIFRAMAQQDPKFDEKLEQFRREHGIQLSPMLGEPLGGEFTFALDGPMLPLPSWKLIAEVYSPDRMQWAIEQLIKAVNDDVQCQECKLQLAKEDSGGRTYYTVTSNRVSYEIDYTYVDGYIVVAPSRSLLTRAIQNRDTGYVLSRSEAFRSQLPSDGRLNFSALVFHNIGSALSPLAGALTGISPAQRASIQALAANSGPGLIYAYGQPESITVASAGSFFGLDINTLALPALMQNLMPKQNHDRKGGNPRSVEQRLYSR
jgi:hypothetical protein